MENQTSGTTTRTSVRRRIRVAEIVDSRYSGEQFRDEIESDQWYTPGLFRPLSWDERIQGIDTVTTIEGETIKLSSTGDQSVPRAGWVLLLTGGNAEKGYTWTLYGIPPHN